jgi:predicted membrane protein
VCTFPTAINPAGAITGLFADSNAALHAFVRSPQGAFVMFDVPGAVCPYFFSTCTWPEGITPGGEITGVFCDAVTCHGFLRSPAGAFTSFDPPGSLFMFPPFIGGGNFVNAAGAVVGCFFGADFVLHGFLRSPTGAFTEFDAPGATNGTCPVAIDPAGTIAGIFADANFVQHGFIRSPNGIITDFDPPGSIFTAVGGINPAGTVGSTFPGTVVGDFETSDLCFHGFLLNDAIHITKFDAPGARCTFLVSINPAGDLLGVEAPSGLPFVRFTNGTLTTFEPQGALVTFPSDLNPAGMVTGSFVDANFLGHGFLFIPR